MVLIMDFVSKDCVDFDSYIAEALIPLNTHIDAFKAKIEHLIKYLKEKTSLKIRRAVKGGSLEKGTAIKGKTDSEIILYLDEFRSVQDQKTKMPDVLAKIERCLQKYGSSCIRNIKHNKLSVQSEVLIDQSWFSVSISPSYDVFGNGFSKTDAYNKMLHNYELRDYFSSALTEVRLEVFRKLPFKLKNLMRLVNHWNIHIAQQHSNPIFSANFVESVVIWCWKGAGAGDDFDTARGMKTVMCELAKGTDIYIDWQGCHLIEEYQLDGEKTISKHPELPLILDPVNPTVNMCEPFNNHKGTGISFWKSVSQFAVDTNKQPLLHDVTVW